MDYLREVFDKKRIKLLISAGISLVVGLILVLIGVKVAGSLIDQNFAKRWIKDDSYAQVTAFFSELADFNDKSARELEYKISNKLTEESFAPESEDSRLWVYCYSAIGKVEVSSKMKSTSVKAIGVGGDFFMFHPKDIINGSLFSGDTMMKDLVVINEDTAFELFGSNDVVGQAVEIGGVRHIICGVVKREEGKLNDKAGNNEPTMYLSYEALSEHGKVTYINSFEALLPNPLTNYAKDLLQKQISVPENRFDVIENSHRFKWTKLLINIKNFGLRSMNPKGLVYTYWENIARGIEDYLTPVTVIATILLLYPCAIILYVLKRMWNKRRIHRGDVKDFAERRLEEYRERRKLAKRGEDEYEEI